MSTQLKQQTQAASATRPLQATQAAPPRHTRQATRAPRRAARDLPAPAGPAPTVAPDTVTANSGTSGTVPSDSGMATAEYAVATLAAVGFAGLLLAVLSSGEVQEMLVELVRRALTSV